MTYGTDRIAEERNAQIQVNGYTFAHDDEHTEAELARAAKCYLSLAIGETHPRFRIPRTCPPTWPWQPKEWRPSTDPIKNLMRAGAMIAAEIDRIHRDSANRNVESRG